MLLGCMLSAHADEDTKAPGTYLSAQLGGGRIAGGNASGNRWMRSRAGEFGIGPYFTMNTSVIDGRQLDDYRWGLLLSAALRVRPRCRACTVRMR
jgi:hypothetical protein